MAVFSTRYRYIFFANPQTASKAIARTLLEALDGQPMPQREIRADDGEILVKKHHATWRDLQDHGLMTRAELDGLFKFTCVRNPYDLLVSRYLKRKGRFTADPARYRWAQDNARIHASMGAAQSMGFPEWVGRELQRHRDKGSTVKGPLEYLDHADHIIRFEALQQGFDEVLQRLGVAQPVPIVAENVTSERAEQGERRHYSTYYDDDSRAWVAKAYAPIIERFGYRFEG